MDQETQMTIIKMGAFAASIGPGLIVLGKLTKGVSSAYSGIDIMAKKIGVASKGLKEFSSHMGTSCVSAINKFVSGFFAPMTQKIGTALSPMLNKVQQAFSKLGTIATAGASKLQKVATLAMKLVGPFAIVGLLLAGLGLAQSQFGEQLDKFLTIAIDTFRTRLTDDTPRCNFSECPSFNRWCDFDNRNTRTGHHRQCRPAPIENFRCNFHGRR